ncbi:AI-2E family transporter [Streptococcus caprae]|uniref:AI-2E family transporter n=1 Tax=Streptococcus caprae TaxID=1640501 RepID=A0ABV8CVI0_9STRE
MKNDDWQDKGTSNKGFGLSWFSRLFLNNQAAVVLMVTLLFFLNVLVFTQISTLFEPIWQFFAIIMLPLIISAIFYYLLKPVVSLLVKQGMNKTWAILLVLLGMLGLIIWGISSLVPMIEDQLTAFFINLPTYIEQVEKSAVNLLKDERLASFRPQLVNMLENYSQKAIEFVQSFSSVAVNWASNFASAFARITVAIIMAPFILFYLLRDSDKMKAGMVSVVPTKMRTSIGRILSEINNQLSGYVQGQITVAVIVGIMFAIMFTIIGLPYAVTFGIMAGILNMIPYLGSFLAMVPVVILGLVYGPVMLVKVIVVFIVEQTIEGRFVTPLIIGSKLSIHPITILFILLTSGSMFGVWGVFLGIPVYASIKVVVVEIFNWYKAYSGLYEEDHSRAVQPENILDEYETGLDEIEGE